MSSPAGELAATKLEQWTYLREFKALSLPFLISTTSIQMDVKVCWGYFYYFFFFKCELFSIALWPATRYPRCTMAL